MRRWMLVAVVAAAARSAQAADLPDLSDLPVLRGGITDGLSRSSVNWQGAYIGGHAAYSSANMDFSNATSSLTSFMLQNIAYEPTVSSWTLLGRSSPVSAGFGGFVGYNAQWDDALLGIEANYTHLSDLTGASSNTLPPLIIAGGNGCWQFPGKTNTLCAVQLGGTASAQVADVLTLRGRAGYAVGNFLPYMFGGLALGRVNITRSVTVTENDSYSDNSTYSTTQSSTAPNNNLLAYGYTAGGGFEALLWGGLFGRVEYEYVKFVSVKDINVQMSTVRAGFGYKF